MNRNIELKARYPDLESAHRVARETGAVLHAVEWQRDTYFRATVGRLKLRERRALDPDAPHAPVGVADSGAGRPSQLIWYQRPDQADARGSDYSLVEVSHGAYLRELLGSALGVAAEVVKHRTIYLHDGVRIHVDQVAGLGPFIEFEAIVDGSRDEETARAKLKRLVAAFSISDRSVQTRSYGDLIAASS